MKHPKVNIFILCFNESVLLPHTIHHYRTMLPLADITIYDNESSDDSVKIAKSLGCKVVSWSSKGILNELNQTSLKNKCWKSVKEGWVIVLDMDEWLCVTEADLNAEEKAGTTILDILGYDMIGTSKEVDLHDINLHRITRANPHKPENKSLCFFRPDIKEINYSPGAHTSMAEGNVKYSKKKYINKHMSSLGMPFLVNKMKERFKRTHKMRAQRMATHYTTSTRKIRNLYNGQTKKSRKMKCSKAGYCMYKSKRKNSNRK